MQLCWVDLGVVSGLQWGFLGLKICVLGSLVMSFVKLWGRFGYIYDFRPTPPDVNNLEPSNEKLCLVPFGLTQGSNGGS